MSDLEELRWAAETSARVNHIRELLDAPTWYKEVEYTRGDLAQAMSIDRSWIASAVAMDPATYNRFDDLWYWEHPQTTASVAIHEASHFVACEQLLMEGADVVSVLGHLGVSGLNMRVNGRARRDVLAVFGVECVQMAILSAGSLGETIATGRPWKGPIVDLRMDDFKKVQACMKILEEANPHQLTLPAVARAQQLALALLDTCWTRVIEVAAELMERGSYVAKVQAQNHIELPAVFTGVPVATAGEVGG